ncbi:EndoU domain-containing protein [Listeria marthii]|uniref:EndoU domain-containing protein n=1 Tax=Listeria marthii TaxID=529731 RepID=UPI002897EC40|nr:EndoU domain-containing protein [Listeria marthii]
MSYNHIEEKILWGQRKNLNKNEIIGGHSSNINNRHSNYAVEIVKINPDGTKEVRFTTQFSDGNLAAIKKSTIFPEDWSNNQILDRVKDIPNKS